MPGKARENACPHPADHPTRSMRRYIARKNGCRQARRSRISAGPRVERGSPKGDGSAVADPDRLMVEIGPSLQNPSILRSRRFVLGRSSPADRRRVPPCGSRKRSTSDARTEARAVVLESEMGRGNRVRCNLRPARATPGLRSGCRRGPPSARPARAMPQMWGWPAPLHTHEIIPDMIARRPVRCRHAAPLFQIKRLAGMRQCR